MMLTLRLLLQVHINKPERSNSTDGKVPDPSLWAHGQGLFTVEYSLDHSGCCMKRQTEHEQKCCYTHHQQLASSKQRDPQRAPGALQEYLQTTKMSQDTQTCAVKDLNKH